MPSMPYYPPFYIVGSYIEGGQLAGIYALTTLAQIKDDSSSVGMIGQDYSYIQLFWPSGVEYWKKHTH